MNERIQQLSKQAGFIHFASDEDCDTPIDWSCDYTEELEKFAKLIVRECISACATDRLGKTLGAEELIKKHFGVEQ